MTDDYAPIAALFKQLESQVQSVRAKMDQIVEHDLPAYDELQQLWTAEMMEDSLEEEDDDSQHDPMDESVSEDDSDDEDEEEEVQVNLI